MKIAVISPFLDRHHGTERVLAETIERLAHRYGCEVHIYSQHVEGIDLDKPGAAVLEKKGRIVWRRVPRLPRVPHLVQFCAWIALNGIARRLDRTFRRQSFDLVVSPGINSLHPDVCLVHVFFRRVQKLSREGSLELRKGRGFLRELHRRAYYFLLVRLEQSVYKNRNVSIAAVSRRTAGLLEDFADRRDIQVIPNAVNTSQFSPEARLLCRAAARRRHEYQEGDFVLLLIGNDWRLKGVPAVLQAIAAIRDVPCHFVALGSDASEAFREMAKSLGIEERCTWILPSAEVLEFYALADVYVSPSLEDAFALPPLEAMACGLPVITSVNDGGSQIITDGVDGFVLANPKDTAFLARLLRRLYEQPQLRRSAGEAAARTAKTYTWDRNARETWEFLTAALEKKRQPKSRR